MVPLDYCHWVQTCRTPLGKDSGGAQEYEGKKGVFGFFFGIGVCMYVWEGRCSVVATTYKSEGDKKREKLTTRSGGVGWSMRSFL